MIQEFDRCRIYDSVLDAIGGTPMVRLDRLAKAEGIECEILAKCEFFNSGGSVKDRIAKRMLLEGEKSGIIKKGSTIIEPTSGNTGIGLALASTALGFKSITVLPEKMRGEKTELLKALGSTLYITPTEAPSDSEESHIGVADRLNKSIEDSWIPNQYENDGNWKAHYETTAEEILAQCDGAIDVFLCGAGTGGTISGISKKLKEKIPGIRVVGVEPKGSILADPDKPLPPEENVPYLVEGIGYDFVPKVLDRSLVDEWIKTDDKESFIAARKLITHEGILCGGSSGSALSAALKVAKNMKKGQRIVIILPDSIRNYMSKFLSPDWLVYHGLAEPEKPIPIKGGKPITELKISSITEKTADVMKDSMTLSEALKFLCKKGSSHAAVAPESKLISPTAVISKQIIMSCLCSKLCDLSITLSEFVKLCKEKNIISDIFIVNHEASLAKLVPSIISRTYVIVDPPENERSSTYPYLKIVTDTDLFNFTAKYGIDISKWV